MYVQINFLIWAPYSSRVNQIVVKTFDNVVVLLLLLSLEQLAKMTGTCKKS